MSEKWVSAEDLKNGDKILLSDGRYGIVEKITIKKLDTSETTYNFEVADFHTYYVGENSVCVHNKGCPTYKDFAVEQNGIEVRVNPGEGGGNVPHKSPHAHVQGQGPSTTVGLDKIPMKGHAPLSGKQIDMIDDNWSYIEKIIRKVWPK